MRNYIKPFFLFIIFLIFLCSCGRNYTPEEEKYVEEIEKFREGKDTYMENNPGSPFNYKGKVKFEKLKYFEPDPEFVFKSRLYENGRKDTIIILGTKGEERKTIRFGYIKFNYKNNNYKVNVYKGTTDEGEDYYSIWFTDKTTGEDTYGVGRYLDFELNPDKDYVYTVDFNMAYNPYCAYSPEYSCAVPTKEDHINLAVEAGEKNFH